LVLALAGAGDELQGIKKGVLELADAIAVNKCDGEGATRARVAIGDLHAALRYLPRKRASWETRVLATSGRTGEGLDAIWDVIEEHRRTIELSGELAALRAEQQRSWMWSLVTERLDRAFRTNPEVLARLAKIEADVIAGRMTPPSAVDALFEAFGMGQAPPERAK
jgi:LAO/AO transport system kinase